MLNNRIIAVFKREVKERVISKGFIIMTLLLPLFMFGIIGIQVLLMKEGSIAHYKWLLLIGFVDHSS